MGHNPIIRPDPAVPNCPTVPAYGGTQRRTRAGALQRSGPKQPGRPLVVPCGRWTRTGLIAPRSSSCGPTWVLPLVHPGRGRNCSLPWTQSCDIPNIARVRGSRGLYRTQELHHFISLAVCRHRDRTIFGAVLGAAWRLAWRADEVPCSKGGRPVASVGTCPTRLENSVLGTEAHRDWTPYPEVCPRIVRALRRGELGTNERTHGENQIRHGPCQHRDPRHCGSTCTS